MKRSSRAKRKVALNALLILGTVGAVIYLGVSNGELESSLQAMCTADWHYLLLAAGCWAVFAFIEGFILKVFLSLQHIRISLGGALSVGIIGVFYSAVTPAATGGQPMQVFAMKKRGVATGVATSALAVKLFCWQTMLVLCGAVLWLLFPEGPARAIGDTKWFILIGFSINGGMMLLVLLLAIRPGIVRALIVLVLNVGHFLHIIKDLPGSASRADAALYDFNSSVHMIRKKPLQLLLLMALTAIGILGLMSAAWCVLRAFGLKVDFGEATTLHTLLYIGASFMPLPGASGAQEGGFYLFFRHLVPEGMLFGVMMIWRFMTYYISIITGLIFVVGDSALSIRRARRTAQSADEAMTKEENTHESCETTQQNRTEPDLRDAGVQPDRPRRTRRGHRARRS